MITLWSINLHHIVLPHNKELHHTSTKYLYHALIFAFYIHVPTSDAIYSYVRDSMVTSAHNTMISPPRAFKHPTPAQPPLPPKSKAARRSSTASESLPKSEKYQVGPEPQKESNSNVGGSRDALESGTIDEYEPAQTEIAGQARPKAEVPPSKKPSKVKMPDHSQPRKGMY